MSGRSAVPRVLALFAECLERYLHGDELAFETLGERLDQGRFSIEELEETALTLRGVDEPLDEEPTLLGPPGARAQRVLSAEERGALTPEAWGLLLGLRRGGSLSAGQFERVLEMLGGSDVRPADTDVVLEIATRVAMLGDDDEGGSGTDHGELDLAN